MSEIVLNSPAEACLTMAATHFQLILDYSDCGGVAVVAGDEVVADDVGRFVRSRLIEIRCGDDQRLLLYMETSPTFFHSTIYPFAAVRWASEATQTVH